MNLRNLSENVRDDLDRGRYGVAAGRVWEHVVCRTQRGFTSVVRPGRTIWEWDWDVMLVIDGCRYDLFDRAAGDFDVVADWEPVRSASSATGEWIERTFNEEFREEVERTTFVAGNPRDDLPRDMFAEFVEVSDTYWWQREGMGTTPAEAVTVEATELYRSGSLPMVVHYIQPHFPSKPDPFPEAQARNKSVWEALRVGDVTAEAVWESYEANLRYVLEEVELFLGAVSDDTDVMLTSDHGNMFGEYGVYSHRKGTLFDEVRTVPLATLDPSGLTETNEEYEENESEPKAREERLEDLGYV